MLKTILSIFDSKAIYYHKPFFANSEAEGRRIFSELANGKEEAGNQISKHPADFILVSIGTYDELTGVITSHVHVPLGSGSSYIDVKSDIKSDIK